MTVLAVQLARQRHAIDTIDCSFSCVIVCHASSCAFPRACAQLDRRAADSRRPAQAKEAKEGGEERKGDDDDFDDGSGGVGMRDENEDGPMLIGGNAEVNRAVRRARGDRCGARHWLLAAYFSAMRFVSFPKYI